MLQGSSKQAGSKQGQTAGSTDKGQAAPVAAAAQSQAPAASQPASGSKTKPAKQGSKIQQQQKASAESPAMSLPSDVFAHLPKYKVLALQGLCIDSMLFTLTRLGTHLWL